MNIRLSFKSGYYADMPSEDLEELKDLFGDVLSTAYYFNCDACESGCIGGWDTWVILILKNGKQLLITAGEYTPQFESVDLKDYKKSVYKEACV